MSSDFKLPPNPINLDAVKEILGDRQEWHLLKVFVKNPDNDSVLMARLLMRPAVEEDWGKDE